MKHKIAYILTTAVLISTAFIAEKNTAPTKTIEMMPASVDLSDEKQFSYIDSFLSSITDWNTNGQELAIMTNNGYELYAYKQSDEYGKRHLYIPLNSVQSWNINNNELEIITSDGNIYKFDK